MQAVIVCIKYFYLLHVLYISNIAHGQISYNEYFPSSKFRDRIIIKSHQHFHFHSVKRKVLTLPYLHNTTLHNTFKSVNIKKKNTNQKENFNVTLVIFSQNIPVSSLYQVDS